MKDRPKKKYHRGRRKKHTVGSVVSTILLIISIGVLIYAGSHLFTIGKGYHEGEKEYKEIEKLAITVDEEEDRYQVDFDALWEINPDVVAWIRFEEPEVINYPVVQGQDNAEYLYKTFKGYDNTVGTIFLNVFNHATFTDRNTLIYGHYMYNGTMFNELDEYREEEFWKKHPFFYIYTPDGKEIKYHIYSVAEVIDGQESHMYDFPTDEDFQNFIDATVQKSFYDTGVVPDLNSQVVTLSTCTKENNNHRLVVHGVKVQERMGE